MPKRRRAKVIRIGNSLGFRIPKKYFDVMDTKAGDKFDLDINIPKEFFGFRKKKK